MNKKSALTLFLVMLAISMSFVAAATCTLTSLLISDAFNRLKVCINYRSLFPLKCRAGLDDNFTPILDQPTRLEINNLVKNNPGLHFRNICNVLAPSIGVVKISP